MKAPLSWLKDYVSIDLSVDELASRLALTGTEVERVSEFGVPGENDNQRFFVVGKVIGCTPHPDSDHLSVCIVDVGEGEPRTIVCGAPNVATGQTVAVVLPGGVMPGDFKIKEAKLRGVRSFGMIMSEAELDKPGGRAYVFEQDGFTFDAGPTVITAVSVRRYLGGGGAQARGLLHPRAVIRSTSFSTTRAAPSAITATTNTFSKRSASLTRTTPRATPASPTRPRRSSTPAWR